MTEGSGKVPSSLVTWDQSKPLYDASQANSFDAPSLQQGYQGYENESDPFAPPPEDLLAPRDDSKQSAEDKKKKVKSAGSDDHSKSNGHAKEESSSKTASPRVPAPDKAPFTDAKVASAPHSVTDVPFDTPAEDTFDPHAADRVYGFPGMALQINLDSGWAEFVEDDLKQINNHLKAGSKFFAITVRGAMYMIDFNDTSNITQTNPNTRKVRSLRLVSESALKQNLPIPDQKANGASKANDDPGKNAEVTPGQSKQSGGKCCVIS